MNETELLVFEVDRTRCALPIDNVLRIEPAAAITPLPNAPDAVAGVMNVRGNLLPVMDVRQRLNLPAQSMVLEDRLILAKTAKREMVLWVGSVQGVESCSPAAQNHVHTVLEKLPHLSGVTAMGDDLVLIHDLEKFLSDEEDQQLSRALDAATS